jgi:hypothetical protein
MTLSSASTCTSLFHIVEPEVHVMVKGTFIELVASPSMSESRRRSFSDSHLVGRMEARSRHMDMQPCASSDTSTEFLSDPGDTAAAPLDTPTLWPSLPDEGMPVQPLEDTFLPMAWECTETQPEWLMPFDFDGSVFSQVAFGGMNFGCDTFGGDTFGSALDGVCMSQVPTKPDLVDALAWEWGHCGGCTGSDAAPPESQFAFDVDRSTASGDGGSDGPSPRDVERTTVLLRNLPRDFTRAKLVELLEDEGFDGTFDFVYVPMDFSSEASLGYAFVNFVSAGDVRRCWTIFDGLSEWGYQCELKACEVMWAEPCQGLAAHVERYRSSPVMHATVPDEWKPAIFQDGMRMPFPPPTKVVSAPKVRRRGKDREDKQ